jgi:two-component system, NarL family, nitrate/nitrite response regulator NarL
VSSVILVSDQPVLLCGLTHVLESRGFEIAACCTSEELVQALPPGKKIDLAVLDITAGLTFGNLTEVHSRIPQCPVVLWSDMLPLDLVFKTLEFGVRGIIQRTSLPEQISDSLRRVANGEMQIGFGASRDVPTPRKQVSLTPREREIVGRLRQGLRNKQIAAEMNITEGTVKIYLFRLFHKLGVRNRFELARCGVPDQMQFSPTAVGFMTEPNETPHDRMFPV